MQHPALCQSRPQFGAGRGSIMVDVSLVPEAAWREARRRAEVIRPLVESAHRSRHLVQAAAATLGLSERQIHTILRRRREAGGDLTALLPGGSYGGRKKPRGAAAASLNSSPPTSTTTTPGGPTPAHATVFSAG